MSTDTTNKKYVMITGCNGFIGKPISAALSDRYDIVGLDNEDEIKASRDIDYFHVDLTDERSIERGLDKIGKKHGTEIASVIHLAAYYNFSGEPSDMYDKLTVEGTRKLLQNLQRFEVEQFIFSSSMLVHAPTEPGRPITEESPLEPKWDYPESKVRAEEAIARERGEISAVLMRIAGVYTDECDSIPLSQQMRRIFEDRTTAKVYPGDPSHGQPFVHLDDVVESMVLAVEKRHELPELTALLIGEPETMGYGELQREFAKRLRGISDWETEEIPKSLAKTGAWIQDRIPGIEDPFIKPWMIDLADDHLELDISKAKKLLGWTPRHSLRESLPKMARALVDDPEGWYRRHGFDPEDVPSQSEQRALGVGSGR